jgi:hypothetical protein
MSDIYVHQHYFCGLFSERYYVPRSRRKENGAGASKDSLRQQNASQDRYVPVVLEYWHFVDFHYAAPLRRNYLGPFSSGTCLTPHTVISSWITYLLQLEIEWQIDAPQVIRCFHNTETMCHLQ